MKLEVVGIKIDNITKAQAVKTLDDFILGKSPKMITTVYSEFVVFSQTDSEYLNVLNNASLSLPDGMGIIWASKYLSLPLSFKNRGLRVVQAVWQLVYTLSAIIFNPKYIRSVIAEQISGSEFIFDICELAQEKNYSIAIFGGENNVAKIAAEVLKDKFPNLKINLSQSDKEFDSSAVSAIAQSNSDILIIAYSPPKQEKWLYSNLQKLNIKACIGLGGTFDYLAKKRAYRPDFAHYIGLEWLWRLITQPFRLKRMWNAIPVFIWIVSKYKIKN